MPLSLHAAGLRSSLTSLGGIVGTLCGGLAMDQIGPIVMYRCVAAMLAIGTCFYLLSAFSVARTPRPESDNKGSTHIELS